MPVKKYHFRTWVQGESAAAVGVQDNWNALLHIRSLCTKLANAFCAKWTERHPCAFPPLFMSDCGDTNDCC